MIERLFYENLNEELTKRGFFIVTDHAPENCIGICGINGTEKRNKYVRSLQEHYRFAAIKNVIFDVGEECLGGYYEILAGSQTKEPFPMIFIRLKYNDRCYNIAYQCDRIHLFVHDKYGKDATRYFLECLMLMTSKLMGVLKEWITDGKFPLHRFADGAEDIVKE